ncbi:peptidoglycan-binding domain-containing protein [Streptomyces xantholiticus]|uniref:Peptidoglycan-binding protein n=1 Tax=Streptomyces xantholiticus TaxID=68285 RepID=A0ABV1UZR4_9ACTN
MGLDDTEPQRAPGSTPEIAQDIQDSFQAVLDALDAARADLYASDELGGWAKGAPPSWSKRSRTAGSSGFTHPTSSPSAPPAPPPPRRAQPVGRGEGLEGVDPGGRPHVVPPVVLEPLRTGGIRGADTPRHVAVEPLWSRGARLTPVPPPLPVKPRMASGAGPAQTVPPLVFPPRAAPQAGAYRRTGPPPETTVPVTPQRPAPPSDQLSGPYPEAPTPLARARARDRSRGWRRFTARRATRVAGAFGAGAVSGLIIASWLLVDDNRPSAVPSPPSGQPDRPLPDSPAPPLPEIPGTGVLRQGDSGHGVYELQVRLLQVSNIYNGGAIDGRYGMEVRAAVARFQEQYGIRGDETGVYGDDTRHALMLRTK